MSELTSEEKTALVVRYLKEIVRRERIIASDLPITVGGIYVSSKQDDDSIWTRMLIDAKSSTPVGAYPYSPPGGEPVTLTTQQVLRLEACRSYYRNACTAVEVKYLDKIDNGMQFVALIVHLQTAFPQREYTV